MRHCKKMVRLVLENTEGIGLVVTIACSELLTVAPDGPYS